jgi:hypothetical protein
VTAPSLRPAKQRRVQRFVVGLAMSFVAFAIERVVLRAVRHGRIG